MEKVPVNAKNRPLNEIKLNRVRPTLGRQQPTLTADNDTCEPHRRGIEMIICLRGVNHSIQLYHTVSCILERLINNVGHTRISGMRLHVAAIDTDSSATGRLGRFDPFGVVG